MESKSFQNAAKDAGMPESVQCTPLSETDDADALPKTFQQEEPPAITDTEANHPSICFVVLVTHLVLVQGAHCSNVHLPSPLKLCQFDNKLVHAKRTLTISPPVRRSQKMEHRRLKLKQCLDLQRVQRCF